MLFFRSLYFKHALCWTRAHCSLIYIFRFVPLNLTQLVRTMYARFKVWTWTPPKKIDLTSYKNESIFCSQALNCSHFLRVGPKWSRTFFYRQFKYFLTRHDSGRIRMYTSQKVRLFFLKKKNLHGYLVWTCCIVMQVYIFLSKKKKCKSIF